MSDREAFLRAIAEEPYEPVHHRAFADWLDENGFDDEALLHREWTPARQREAEAFFKLWADKIKYGDPSDSTTDAMPEEYSFTAADLIEAGTEWLDNGEELSLNLNTAGTSCPMEDYWRHYQTVTGRPVTEAQATADFIVCGCW